MMGLEERTYALVMERMRTGSDEQGLVDRNTEQAYACTVAGQSTKSTGDNGDTHKCSNRGAQTSQQSSSPCPPMAL